MDELNLYIKNIGRNTWNIKTLFIPFVLFSGQFFFIFLRSNNRLQEFIDSISESDKSPEEREDTLEKIKQMAIERAKIYVSSTLLSIFLTILLFIYLKKLNNKKRDIFLFISVGSFLQIFFYVISKKKKKIDEYLTPDELKEWKSITKNYKYDYIFGVLVGLCGFITLAVFSCNFLKDNIYV